MSTIATIRIPASEFALDEVLSRTPTLDVRPLRSVQIDGATLSPSLWFQSEDTATIEAGLRADPTASNHSRLFSSADGGVYRVDLRPTADEFMRLFSAPEVSVSGAFGHDGEWVFRALAASRDSLSELTTYWRRTGIDYDVERIVACEDVPSPTRFGLTDAQYHTLVTAFREGYYSVPRESDITAVSNMLGVSHQAASQRLRRGHEQLVQNTLVERPSPWFPF